MAVGIIFVLEVSIDSLNTIAEIAFLVTTAFSDFLSYFYCISRIMNWLFQLY